MKPRDFLYGMRFGRLTVIAYAGRRGRVRLWLCRCDCGKLATPANDCLRNGHTTSCGCSRIGKTGTHGYSRTPEYRIWVGIRERCLSPNSTGFRYYGGRGITIDQDWSDFTHFLRDMGCRPSQKHSMDRIDNEGPYSRENCRWASPHEQRANRRDKLALRDVDDKPVGWSQVARHFAMDAKVLKRKIMLATTVISD